LRAQFCFGVSGAVVESQAAHPVLDELVKTPQVRDHHCAPCRHCLERRETKGFAHFSKAGIDENGRTSIRAYQGALLEYGTSEFACNPERPRKCRELLQVISTIPSLCDLVRADDPQSPLGEHAGIIFRSCRGE
jgi:hypothetical protein